MNVIFREILPKKCDISGNLILSEKTIICNITHEIIVMYILLRGNHPQNEGTYCS